MPKRNRSLVLPAVSAAAGKNIKIFIEGDGESARKALQMVQEQLRETGKESERESAIFERTKQALETVGLYMGIREGIEVLKEMTFGSLELGEALEKAAMKTGLSVESLSVLHYAAGVLGGDFDGLTAGLAKMNNTIGKAADGDKQASAFMAALGLNAKDLTKQADGTEVAFHRFVDRLANTESPIERTRLAMGLLGRAGAQQIPMLVEIAENWDTFKQKAQDAGVLLDGKTASTLADTNQRLNDMKQHFVGLGLSLTEGMTPSLNQMFDVMSHGQGALQGMADLGDRIGRTLAFIAEMASVAGATIENAFASVELGSPMHRDLDRAKEMMEQAQKYHDIAFGDRPSNAQSSFLPKTGKGPHGPGFEGVDTDAGSKTATVSAIAEARTQLLDQTARTEMAKRKAADQVQLAEWEAQHKMELVGDQEFYDAKLKLQTDELDAEEEQLNRKQANLQALLKKQRGDPTLKRRGGTSAEELKTQRELQQVEEQRAAMDARRGQQGQQYTAESNALNKAAELAHLKVAADLEKERNIGIEAQIALIRREHDEEAKRNSLAGGSSADAANIRSTGEVLVQKLELEDVNRRITETENEYKLKIEDVSDKAEKGALSQRQAKQQLQQLSKQEAADLQSLVQQYRQLADVLGGDYKVKADELDETLTKLGRRDQTHDFGHELAEGMESTVTRMADAATRGKQSFSELARSLLNDIDSILLKITEEKFIKPMFEGLLGSPGVAPGGAGVSGPGATLAALGHGMTGFWKAPKPATPGGGAGSALAGIAQQAASKMTPNIVSNLHNNSSQPLQSGEPQMHYSEELKAFVLDTIVENHATGGVVRQLFGSDGE